MKNHTNIVSQEENDSSQEAKLKVMELCHVTDTEFKITVMKKLSDI